MKKLSLLILFLCIIPSALASILLEDWIDDGETFPVGDHYFNVKYYNSNQKLNFKMDDFGTLLLVGECETKENIRYCFEELDYPEEAEFARIKVKIESLEPDISIERSFSTTTPNLNEEIIVSVTLKNEGEKGARDIKYIDIYPIGLKVYSEKNAGEWEGTLLNPGEEKTFTYKITAKEITSYESTATLTYTFGGITKTRKSSTTTIEVKKPYSFIDAISKEAAEKDEIINYSLTLTNEDEANKLTVENLEVTLPSQIKIISANKLNQEENKLTFKGTLEKEETRGFSILMKSSRVGTFIINTKAEIKVGGDSFKEELEKQFTVGLSDIVPMLNLTDTVSSNSPYDIDIALRNYGKKEIKDVNILVESNLIDNIEEKKNIQSGSTYTVFKKTLTAPYIEEDKKYNVKIMGSYVSSSGRTYTFEKSAQLTVKAAPKIIEIIRELNKEEFYPGGEIKIKVKIKNQKNIIITEIDVSDIFPKEIRSSLLGEVTGFLEEIKPNEEQTMYSYSVVVPEDYLQDEIEFKTTLNAKVDGELTLLKRIDKVKIIKGAIPPAIEEQQQQDTTERETQKNISDQEEESIEEKKETTKESFIKRIINWIKNLFRRKEENAE